jgi:hypothetical protein
MTGQLLGTVDARELHHQVGVTDAASSAIHVAAVGPYGTPVSTWSPAESAQQHVR